VPFPGDQGKPACCRFSLPNSPTACVLRPLNVATSAWRPHWTASVSIISTISGTLCVSVTPPNVFRPEQRARKGLHSRKTFPIAISAATLRHETRRMPTGFSSDFAASSHTESATRGQERWGSEWGSIRNWRRCVCLYVP
jgi:hypothetical protein